MKRLKSGVKNMTCKQKIPLTYTHKVCIIKIREAG